MNSICIVPIAFELAVMGLLVEPALDQATETTPQPIARMTDAAEAFTSSLDSDNAQKVHFEFGNETARKDWSNVPVAGHPRNGLSLSDSSDAQKILAHRLIDSALSTQGFAKVYGLIQLDDILSALMEESRPGTGQYFGSEKFWLAIFGKPGSKNSWGWQLDGNHLAINTTVVGDRLSLTPMFLGVEPDVVPRGPYSGLQILGAERRKALAVMRSLTADQRSHAILTDSIPPDIFEGPWRAKSLTKLEGITAAQLSSDQRALPWALIDEYLENCAEQVASARKAKIRAAGDASLHFAWMEPIAEETNVYYRVHGPSILIEYDDTSVGEYGNHV